LVLKIMYFKNLRLFLYCFNLDITDSIKNIKYTYYFCNELFSYYRDDKLLQVI